MKMMRRMGVMGLMGLMGVATALGQVATPIHISMRECTGSSQNRAITIMSLDGPRGFFGTNIVDSPAFTVQPAGGVADTNLVLGNYRFTFAGSSAAMTIFWPADPTITNVADSRLRTTGIVQIFQLTNWTDFAGSAARAGYATNAGSAATAVSASVATYATNANYATNAGTAASADTVSGAVSNSLLPVVVGSNNVTVVSYILGGKTYFFISSAAGGNSLTNGESGVVLDGTFTGTLTGNATTATTATNAIHATSADSATTAGSVSAGVSNAFYSVSNPSSYVTAAVTNGLASTAYVNAATNGLVTAAVTNGLATIAYVNAATNGLSGGGGTNGGIPLAAGTNVTVVQSGGTNIVSAVVSHAEVSNTTNGLLSAAYHSASEFQSALGYIPATNSAAGINAALGAAAVTNAQHATTASGMSGAGLTDGTVGTNKVDSTFFNLLLGGSGVTASGSNTFSGVNIMTNPANVFAGDGSGLTGVHPFFLGGMSITNYGAVPWKISGNASVTSNSVTVQISDGNFTTNDLGSGIKIKGGGVYGGHVSAGLVVWHDDVMGIITNIVDSQHVQISQIASNTAGPLVAVWGPDNALAFQAANNYMATNGGITFIPVGRWGIVGSRQDPTNKNAILITPNIAQYGMVPIISYEGVAMIGINDWAFDKTPATFSSIIEVCNNDPACSAFFKVNGGPANGINGGPGVSCKNIGIIMPANPQMACLDLQAAATAKIDDCYIGTDSDAEPRNTNGVGVLMPGVLNQCLGNGRLYNTLLSGFWTGVKTTEHQIYRFCAYACKVGWEVDGSNAHDGIVVDDYFAIGVTTNILVAGNQPIVINKFFTEGGKNADIGWDSAQIDLYDPANNARGIVNFGNNNTSDVMYKVGGAHVRVNMINDVSQFTLLEKANPSSYMTFFSTNAGGVGHSRGGVRLGGNGGETAWFQFRDYSDSADNYWFMGTGRNFGDGNTVMMQIASSGSFHMNAFSSSADLPLIFEGGHSGTAWLMLSNGGNATVAGKLTANGGLAGSLNATNLTGTVAMAMLPSGVVTNNAQGLSLWGTFTGTHYGWVRAVTPNATNVVIETASGGPALQYDDLHDRWFASGGLGISTLFDPNGTEITSVNVVNRELGDSVGGVALEWNARLLDDASSQTAFDWATTNLTAAPGHRFAGDAGGLSNVVAVAINATNAAPSSVTVGTTAPDRWLKITNNGTAFFVPAWIAH